MSNARPIKPNHSIKEVIFALNFTTSLTKDHLELIAGLKSSLESSFPILEPHNGAGFLLNDNGHIEQTQSSLVALTYKKLLDNNETDWTLRAESNFIAINCLDYKGGWSKIIPKVLDVLKIVSEKLISTQLSLNSITLQYVDQFIYEGEYDQYEASTIFDSESIYLNKKVRESGPLWHLYQGWFDGTDDISSRLLNRLNISSGIADNEHLTTIDHSSTIQFTKAIQNPKTLFKEDNAMVAHYFNLLHQTNKNILLNLLNKKRIEDIKLSG